MEAKKSLGQHFLNDAGVLVKIQKEVKSSARIVEIGGGKGALTEHLVKLNVPLTVVEIDEELAFLLKEQFKKHDVEVLNQDAASFRLKGFSTIVGNLPYNISKRIIRNFVFQKENIEKMVFMVQREVADSIVAKRSTKQYSKFSVLVQLFFKVRRLFNVKRGAFVPPPAVESSVVEFVPYGTNLLDRKINAGFFEFLNILFAHPRKTVKNNIKKITEDFDKLKDLVVKRPEELSIEEMYKIYMESCHE